MRPSRSFFIVPILFAAVASPVILAQTPMGPEFQVNSYTSNNQEYPSVALDAAGHFVVTWTTYAAEGTDLSIGIQARRFASDGSALGAQFQVNTYTTDTQSYPRVARSVSGDFVIVWQGYDASAGAENISARRWDSDGAPVGAQFLVSEFTTGGQYLPAVAVDAQGGFLVVWTSEGSVGDDVDEDSIQGKRFDSDGSSIGAQFQVNAYTTSSQDQASVGVDQAGNFVVVWSSYGSFGDDVSASSVQARRYASDGAALGAQFQINTYTTQWQAQPEVAVNDAGDWVVAWTSNGSFGTDLDETSIQARRYGSDGLPATSEIQVNVFTTGGQFMPSASIDAEGNFSVFWRSAGDEIAGRSFASDGSPLGGQFRVDSGIAGSVDNASSAMSGVGDFIVAWEADASFGTDVSGDSIQARRFRVSHDLGNRVWRDVDGNGLQDGGEPGVAGVSVELLDDGGAPIAQTVTEADGTYRFAVRSGQYSLRVAAPPGLLFTLQDIGMDDVADSDVDASGVTALFQVDADDSTRDAGLVAVVPPPAPPTVPLAAVAEVQVDDAGTGSGVDPAIASRSTGEFVVAYRSTTLGDLDGGVGARLFGADGVAVGDEFLVNTGLEGQALWQSVSTDASGRFVIAWSNRQYDGGDADTYGVRARRFASDGTPLGDQFLVNALTTDQQSTPSVAIDASGDFIIVWQSSFSSGTDDQAQSIQGRRFSSDGSPVGGDFQVNTYTTNFQILPSAAITDAGDFVVVWMSYGAPDDAGIFSIRGQRYASGGASLGSEFRVNSYTGAGAGNYNPRVAMDSAGRFVVSWQSNVSSGNDQDSSIQARRFAADGSAVGAQFQVNTYTTGYQGGADVAVDPYGRFLVTWSSPSSTEDSDDSIQGRRYDADGSPVGEQFLVNAYTTGSQGGSSIAVDAVGDFVVAWTGVLPGDPDGGIVVRRLRTSGDVGDRVWLDVDADGLQDLGEPGQAGAAVDLYDGEGVLRASTFTDGQGEYSFSRLVAGEYSLEFALPLDADGFVAQDVGLDDAFDSDADASGVTDVFSVTSTPDASRDAGVVSTRIGDRVWLDADLDGAQDGGEVGVAGVSVELFDSGDVSQGATVTAADGSYAFTGLSPGAYYLVFTAPAGFCFTAQDVGPDDRFDSDVDSLSGTTGLIDVTLGQSAITWDAGLVPEASVGNRVWLDDGDGLQAGGEPGVAGATVNLYASGGALLDTTTTDANGRYVFSPGPGDYYLEVVLPADTTFAPRDQEADDEIDSDFQTDGTSPVFTLSPGEVDASIDAGLEPMEIGDLVFSDLNADGRRQLGEPGVAGVLVRLLDAADAEVAQTLTDADGLYGFAGIATGDYRIEVVLPAGTFTAQDVGDDDLIDSDVDANGRTVLFHYVAGDALRRLDAGVLDVIFIDSFESGDTSRWSRIVP